MRESRVRTPVGGNGLHMPSSNSRSIGEDGFHPIVEGERLAMHDGDRRELVAGSAWTFASIISKTPESLGGMAFERLVLIRRP